MHWYHAPLPRAGQTTNWPPDLASSALGGKVLSFSDEFFAEAANLINPAAPIRRAGHFVPTGAWYDGWETRRHNPEPADWVIIKARPPPPPSPPPALPPRRPC